MIAPGAILDRYEILRPLAAGGMGEIHLARLHGAAGFGALVAIKALIGNLSTNKAFVSMFLDEARNVAKLRHKNIVQIRDINQHAGQYYMVMEYIPGQNLRELLGDVTISDTPLFGPKLGADVFSDLASALAAVHHAGLVHRDLSPNNVMIGDEGVAKLIDFGVARAVGSASLTSPGTLKGKFTYMAPEYIKSQAYDHRVDLFSLGVVMWETFSRRRLFRGVNAAEQLHQVLEAPIPRLDQVIRGFPAPLADVVAACLVRDPEQRIASAVEVADRLGELARELPEAGDRTLRRWLERRVVDRIEARRRDDREIVERGPEVVYVPPPAEIEISTNPAPVRTATPLPTRASGFHAIGRSMGSATSVRMAAGEAIAPVTPRSRTRLFVAAGASVAVLAIVVAVATSRGGAGAPPPATPSVAPRPSADAELHRQRGISALQAKNYVGAISELAEAIRIGGADADLLQLMELARWLQHDAHESAAVPPDAGVLDAAAIRRDPALVARGAAAAPSDDRSKAARGGLGARGGTSDRCRLRDRRDTSTTGARAGTRAAGAEGTPCSGSGTTASDGRSGIGTGARAADHHSAGAHAAGRSGRRRGGRGARARGVQRVSRGQSRSAGRRPASIARAVGTVLRDRSPRSLRAPR